MTGTRHDDDHAPEPIPGLPRALPAGETLLWQGRPRWQGLARHTFHIPWVAAYFAILAVVGGVGVLPIAALCLAILCVLAWLNARATVYTITSKRVVMRFGVALPMTFNLPFKRIASADLRAAAGDISLALAPPDRIGWLFLWPHVRPWRFARAQPTLRALPDAARVAAILREAVRT